MAQPRILIVEDEYITALELQERLEGWGYSVVGRASTGEKALLLARELTPDLVLMDILLKGGLDGVETAENIQLERDVPIVYVTAYADERTLQRAKITTPYGYILKPFEERELRIVLEMTLYKAHVEHELRQYRERLEELVAARTAELSKSNTQLQQEIVERKRIERELRQAKEASETAQKEAEAANRMKSEFLANMSHELRTPLNGVLGYAQILKEHHDLSPQQQAGLDVIERSGTHLLTILTDLLELSIPEQYNSELLSTSFSLATFCRELIQVTHIRAREKGLEFVVDIAPDVPHFVYGDARRLRQILLNLLGNALKFTEQGSVTLNVAKMAETEKEGQQSSIVTLQFSILDTGIGIATDQLERIFEPFERVNDGRLYTEGPGVGLSISRRFVRQMGGELRVESTVGQGSRFWFDLSLPVDETRVEGSQKKDTFPLLNRRAETAPRAQESSLSIPPPAHLSALQELALDGDIKGIRAYLKDLEDNEPQYQAFIDTTRHFADAWQISAIQTFLESHLSTGKMQQA